jgi:hypothetical protein
MTTEVRVLVGVRVQKSALAGQLKLSRGLAFVMSGRGTGVTAALGNLKLGSSLPYVVVSSVVRENNLSNKQTKHSKYD